MQTENNSQKKAGSKISIKKIFLWMLVFLCMFFLILFFTVPVYLSSDSGKNLILRKVNSSIDGKVAVGSLSMGWFAGVKADRVNFTNIAGTAKMTAEQVAVRPSYLALIGGKLEIDDLAIKQGNFKISSPDANRTMQTLELKDINGRIASGPLGAKSGFYVSMAVASANEVSNIVAVGQIETPKISKKQWSLADATGELSIEVNDLELSTLSPLFAALDVNAAAAGRVKADINAKMQKGQFENLQGTINASNLDIAGSFLKGDRLQSSKFQTDIKLNTTEKTINIDRLKIEADGLSADIKGTVPKTLRSLEDFLRADSTDTLQAQFDCDVAKTFKQVKTIAKFKQDFDINYGRLSGNINTEAQNGTRTLAGKVKLWALEGKFPVRRIILSKPVEIDAKLVSQKEQITVEKLNVDSSFVKAQLSGTTDNMNYTADLDLAKMQSDVGQFFDIKPQLSGSVQLIGKGSLANRIFASTGSASLNNITITMPDGSVFSEPSANAGFDFQADIDKKQLNVKTTDISASFGKINISNLTTPLGKDTAEPMQFDANFAVELEKLNDWATALGKTDTNTHLAGFARGDLAFRKADSIIEASAKQITVENLKISSPGKETFTQPIMTISFAGKFNTAEKIYDIPQLSVIGPQIKISGSLSNTDLGTKTKTEGNFKADYDLAAAGPIVSPFLPQGFSATGKRSDILWFSSTWPKNLPQQFKANLNAKTTFGFNTAEYMGLDIGKSEFKITIDNGLMTIAPFSTTVNNGKFNFAATANFAGNPAMLQTPGATKMFDRIQITRRTSDALLRYVVPLFADATSITGILNFDCEKLAIPLEKGYRNAIAVAGTVSVEDMHLFGTSSLLNQLIQLTGASSDPTITVLPTRFVLADGILQYDNMQVNIGDKPVNFSGKIGLDKSMRMNVTLPWTHNGQRITLPLKGTVDKPQIDVGKLMEEQAKQEFERQIKKGLEKILK
jgi:type II secretion system protein N